MTGNYIKIVSLSGYTFVIDIIDHFSKYMRYFNVVNNNIDNTMICFKKIDILKGFPKILQSDN